MSKSEASLPESEWPCERPDFGPKQIRSEDEMVVSRKWWKFEEVA